MGSTGPDDALLPSNKRTYPKLHGIHATERTLPSSLSLPAVHCDASRDADFIRTTSG